MARERHLSQAPIKEAVIDIRVVLPEDASIKVFEASSEPLLVNYPVENTINVGSFGLKVEETGATQTDIENKLVGYRFSSQDGTRIVQFRLNGFTFSCLEPYDTWEKMKQEAMELWEVYVKHIQPMTVIRVATRYINVMPIPLPISNLEDVLVEAPKVPEKLPQTVSSFYSRLAIQKPEIEATGIIIQAFEAVDNHHAPITLDIDVFVNKEYTTEDLDFWECLDKLRDFKNNIFFESITEKTAELFE